ncbi:MAG TPA: rod shape-determining protein MreC, partial [Anaeromyxobacteraceae bacterium]
MLQILKRYRDLLAVAGLLVVPLAVYVAHARHPGERTTFDRAIVRLARPVERAVGALLAGAMEAWD